MSNFNPEDKNQIYHQNVFRAAQAHFNAVTEVARIQAAKEGYVSAGAYFLTVKFTQERGNLIVAYA